MARDPYNLNQYATFTVKSYNGDQYNCAILWTGTANTRTWTLAKDGLKLSWESEKAQDKNSPILASKCTLSLMVTDGAMQLFLQNIRSTKNEKDVWLTITHANGNKLLWCGYFILDLEAQEDVSLPNETTLVAVDGIATLKEVPLLRETTLGTSTAPTFPYTANDTYYNAGWQRVIGNSTSWLKLICEATGQLLDTDSTSTTLEDYFISTSFNWWNEDMGVSPDVTNDPLANMKINIRELHRRDENNIITPPSVYELVKIICRNFNMRFFYWQHKFYFAQIGEYNTDENGSIPFSTVVNIPTRIYFHVGSSQTTHKFIGNNNYSMYFAQIEPILKSAGLQKIAGTIYQAIPAIKKVNIFYKEFAGSNHFTGYPLFVTHNTLQTPTAFPTDGAYHEFTQQSESNGILNVMSFTDADTLAGFIVRIYGSFSNSSTGNLTMETAWSMRAKPASSNFGDSDNYVAFKFQAANFAEIRWMSIDSGNEFPLDNNQQYIRDYITIPANCTNEIINIWDSSTTTTTNTTGNLFPTDPAFVGDWDFQFWTFTGYDNATTFQMQAQGNNALYSHGRIMNGWGLQGTNVSGTTPMVRAQTPSYYAFDYTDAIDMNGQFLSRFVPVMDNAQTNGNTAQQIQVNQDSSDTFVYDVGEIFFGDGSGANSTATIKVYDGANWVFVDALGKWGLAEHAYNSGTTDFDWTISYNKKLQDLLGEEILNNQSRSILTLNGTTVLSANDKFYTGSSKRKWVSPVARIVDADGKKYMMMRSTFNFVKDEWQGEWVQMQREVPTLTTNTQTWDDDIPDDPIIAM